MRSSRFRYQVVVAKTVVPLQFRSSLPLLDGMQVNPSVLSLSLPRQLPPTVRGWMLGQVLDAVVIGREGQNSIRLNIGGTELTAATRLPLRSGDRLTVQVSQLRPVVTLRPAPATAAPEKALLQAEISRALPAQQPLAKSFDAVARTLGTVKTPAGPANPRPELPPAAVRSAERLLAAVPRLADLVDPQRLPAIVRGLGVFAESALAGVIAAPRAGAQIVEGDLKLQLLRLKADLEPPAAHKPDGARSSAARTIALAHQASSPPSTDGVESRPRARLPLAPEAAQTGDDSDPARRLSRIVDGALAKIETNQLRTVATRLDGDPQWHLDLPVLIDDGHRDLRLQILPDGNADRTAEAESNTIALDIPLDEQSSLRAEVRLSGESLAVKLWSDDPGVRAAVVRRRDELSDRLRANGLDEVFVSLTELRPLGDGTQTFRGLVDTTA